MNAAYGMISLSLVVISTLPYIRDVLSGRAVLSRSTRILFLLLMMVTLLAQKSITTSWVLALTVGEILSQLALFFLSFWYGTGGYRKLDLACYSVFAVSLFLYFLTETPILSLVFLIVTDVVGFVPTVVKNWKNPASDTWFFYVIGGVVAPSFSIAARDTQGLPEILFPIYLICVNSLAVYPVIFRRS